MKGDKINIPFLGTDKESIKDAKKFALKEYPKACQIKYVKPEWIELKGKFKHESFWTHPLIEVYL